MNESMLQYLKRITITKKWDHEGYYERTGNSPGAMAYSVAYLPFGVDSPEGEWEAGWYIQIDGPAYLSDPIGPFNDMLEATKAIETEFKMDGVAEDDLKNFFLPNLKNEKYEVF